MIKKHLEFLGAFLFKKNELIIEFESAKQASIKLGTLMTQ